MVLFREKMDVIDTGDKRGNATQFFFDDDINSGIRIKLPNSVDERGAHHHIAKPVGQANQYFEI